MLMMASVTVTFYREKGNIPLEGILREIRRAGYDGCATIELVTGYLKEPSVYAELAIERIREMLKNE